MRFDGLKRRTEIKKGQLDIAPLIDVVFLLLIFFMVSTVFINFTKKMDIELPESKIADLPPDRKSFEIEMMLDKKIYLDGEEVAIEKLELRLKNLSEKVKEKAAIIKADRGLPYGEVIKVMGICKAVRIMDIGVAVK